MEQIITIFLTGTFTLAGSVLYPMYQQRLEERKNQKLLMPFKKEVLKFINSIIEEFKNSSRKHNLYKRPENWSLNSQPYASLIKIFFYKLKLLSDKQISQGFNVMQEDLIKIEGIQDTWEKLKQDIKQNFYDEMLINILKGK